MNALVLSLVIALGSLLPLIVLCFYAVAPGWHFPEVIPSEFNTQSLLFVSSQAETLWRHMVSSLGYSFLSVLLSFLLCLSPAHHFARRQFWGKTVLEGIFLAPALVPAMTFSMGVHYLFILFGLAETYSGVVLVLTIFSSPYMFRALIAGYQAFGEEFDLCAKNLGAGPIQRFVFVELPLLLPAVIAGGTVVFLVAFSEYFLVFLIGGGVVESYTTTLFPYLNASNRSLGAVLTLIFILFPLFLFLCLEWIVASIYRKRGLY